MATTTMDYENANGDRYDDEPQRYDRDQRSASPRGRDDGENGRRRSASPGAGMADRQKDDTASKGGEDDEGAINPGSNLFVTGIHPKLSEQEVTRIFEKYGEVEKCQIMRDPHTKESRGFGFVKMVTSDQADAAKEGLQGEVFEGRTLSIEKARRSRPRTPTPGKYFGPPKRAEPRRPFNDRYEDRRRGGYSGYSGRDDPYRYRGYDRRYEDRAGYDRGYREERGGYERGYREDRGYDRRERDDSYNAGGRVDRYGGGAREDRERGYGQRGPDERRSGPGYERERGYDRPAEQADGPRPERNSGRTGYGDSSARPEGGSYGGRD